MRQFFFFVFLLFLISCEQGAKKDTNAASRPEYVLLIHGGAGYGTRADMSPEREKAYHDILECVLDTGSAILSRGGSSLDAVEAAIRIMENSPMFNAGKGAVFTEQGCNELDASIMDGRDLNAGAVAGVRSIRNPISAAREVMTGSKHVLLIGEGAEKFAAAQGIEMVDPSYFYTERRWRSLQRIRKKQEESYREKSGKFSTVGAVALDQQGNLAAGTSTGGMTNKMAGRVGDSPVIGAGTYADNETCAVSATGHGEYFIRHVVAYDISALMKYKGWGLEKAANHVINKKLKSRKAGGGVIALDNNGMMAATFNTTSMIRAWVTSDGEKKIFLYEE
ncbi:MAG: isoaspartyl peptidase/L-asparaginase [Bacteroidales bacterium]